MDPLRAPATPQLLTWQLAGLALTWADQDQHPNQPQAFAVLADPDVIAASDVTPGPRGRPHPDPARTAHHPAVHLRRAARRDPPANPSDPAAALTGMQNLALPDVDLADLEAQDGQGVDISAALAAAGLTRTGFLFLRELARLAATGTVTGMEWTDAIAVLTAAFKRRQYPTWRSQETGFVLSPDFFVLAQAAPQVNPYREDSRARDGWQAVLRSRIAQRQDLIDGNARAVAATEQATLPILRDALLADLAPTTTGNVGEAMSTRFLIDVLAGGYAAQHPDPAGDREPAVAADRQALRRPARVTPGGGLDLVQCGRVHRRLEVDGRAGQLAGGHHGLPVPRAPPRPDAAVLRSQWYALGAADRALQHHPRLRPVQRRRRRRRGEHLPERDAGGAARGQLPQRHPCR